MGSPRNYTEVGGRLLGLLATLRAEVAEDNFAIGPVATSYLLGEVRKNLPNNDLDAYIPLRSEGEVKKVLDVLVEQGKIIRNPDGKYQVPILDREVIISFQRPEMPNSYNDVVAKVSAVWVANRRWLIELREEAKRSPINLSLASAFDDGIGEY